MDVTRRFRHQSTEPLREGVFFSNDNLFMHNRVGGKGKRKKGQKFFLVESNRQIKY